MRATLCVKAATIALFVVWGGVSQAQMQRAPIPREAHEEAQRSLPVLRQMVTPETYKRLGFDTPEEVQKAELGTPMRVFMVRLDRLREYRAEANPMELLDDTHEIRYPVVVGGQVKSSIVMHEVEGKWQLAKFGRPLLTRVLTEQVRRRNERMRTPEESFFEVKIPALNLYFVGREEDSHLTLTSAAANPKYEVKEGEEVGADKLFSRLAQQARELKTGPYLSD